MHRQRILKRQIFVTAVVFTTPVKIPAQAHSVTNGAAEGSGLSSSQQLSSLAENPVPPLLLPILPNTPNIQGEASPVSPRVQQKIEEIEKQTSSSSDLTSENISRVDKRKSESSPETAELSRKEKKVMREEGKKQDKMKKKLDYKEKNTLQVQVNHSY